jgi:translation initiation factor 5A
MSDRISMKDLKAGRFVVIDGEPCKVVDLTVSVPGKHGGAKARLEAVGVFDNKKRSIVKPADTEIEVPIVEKRSGQIVAIAPPNVSVMDLETYETFDTPIPEDLKEKIVNGAEVQYWVLMGKKMIVQVKG